MRREAPRPIPVGVGACGAHREPRQGCEGRDAYRTCCCHHCIKGPCSEPQARGEEAATCAQDGKLQPKPKLKPKLQPKEQPEEKPGEEVAKSSKGPPVFLKPKQKPPGAPQHKWSGGSWWKNPPRIARQTYSLPRADGRISCHTSAVHIMEVYSPARFSKEASRFGLKPGFAIDLEEAKPDGSFWDLSRPEDVEAVNQLIDRDEPVLLIGSPPCDQFSHLQNVNKYRVSPDQRKIRICATHAASTGSS